MRVLMMLVVVLGMFWLLYTPETLAVHANGRVLKTTASLDFPLSAATGCDPLTVTVTSAALNDVVTLGVPNGSVGAESAFFGWVSAANTVTVTHCAHGLATDPAVGSFWIVVTQFF